MSAPENRLFLIQITDTTFKVKTPKGKLFTPSRVMLLSGEKQMNMLSPDEPRSLFHADINTGEYAFSSVQKFFDIELHHTAACLYS